MSFFWFKWNVPVTGFFSIENGLKQRMYVLLKNVSTKQVNETVSVALVLGMSSINCFESL